MEPACAPQLRLATGEEEGPTAEQQQQQQQDDDDEGAGDRTKGVPQSLVRLIGWLVVSCHCTGSS